MKRVISICPYCGCGCKLNYVLNKNKIVKIEPVKDDYISNGKPCVKGLAVHEVVNKNRILTPMIRINNKLKKTTWKKALKTIIDNTKELAPEEILFTASGKIPNEDNYIIQKFARICFQTNNIDSCCTRLCHAATVAGMMDCFGNANLTKMENIDKIDTLLIIGSNPENNYPVFFDKILKNKSKLKLISVQHWSNNTSKHADLSIIIEPCTELILLNGIINEIISSGNYSKDIEIIDGFKRLKETTQKFDEKTVCTLCNITPEQFKKLVESITSSKNLGFFHGMGFTQQLNSIENIHSLLNLAILKNGTIMTLRGEVNVQGTGDMGCLPNQLPNGSYENAAELEKLWNHKIPISHGKNLVEGILVSPVKALFICNFNPAQSLPNLDESHKNLKKAFLVVIASYPDKTTELADVILPSPILPECNGTIANGERRIRKLNIVSKTKLIPVWKIFKELAKMLNKSKYFNYKNEKEIFEEIIKAVPAYNKLNADEIYNGIDGWPDKEIKFRRFMPEKFEGVDDMRNKKYPFLLITHRSKFQFLTGEMTSKSKTLMKMAEEPGFYINSKEAKRLGLKKGQNIIVSSPVSDIKNKIYIDDNLPNKILAASFHSEKLLINRLYPAQFDERTFTPNYKAVAVGIRKA